MTQRPVVVGVDGSPASSVAVAWAVEVAATAGAPVEAVRAWQQPVLLPGPDADAGPGAVADEAQRSVDAALGEALAARPRGAPAVPTRTRVLEGAPGPVLVAAARSGQLLVLGRHGRSAWQRRLARPIPGSAVAECLDGSPVPVAVVPPEGPPGQPQRVVVGLDGSAASVRALHWAAEHAARNDVRLAAVLAWDLTTVPTPATAGTAWTLPPVDDWEQEAQALLDSTLADTLGARAATTVERLVVREQPTPGLLSTVGPADLLVLGDRGRGAVSRLVLGSVARQCVEHAPCPVVVVPSHDAHDGGPVAS